MNDEIRRRREERKRLLLGHEEKKSVSDLFSRYCFSFFSRVAITIILTLLVFITLKNNKTLKAKFYKQVFETNFSFTTVNNWYEKTFGSPIPFKNYFKKEEVAVFHETLSYKEANQYLDGVSLTVENHYLVPLLEGGLVVFQGEKEGYGNTVIIQQSNGIDVWYGNLGEINVKLYEYVEKGSLLGESKDTLLYLVFKKGGATLDYNEYL